MRTLKLLFLALLCLASANAAFAWGAFASSGADCDGDGEPDITCSGGVVCESTDEGEIPNTGGYCICSDAQGKSVDTKLCSDVPSLFPASFSGDQGIWQLLVPREPEVGPQPAPDAPPAQEQEPELAGKVA